MVDPITLVLVGTVVVSIGLISWKKILQWFRSKSHLSAHDADAVGALIVQKLGDRQYHEVDIGFRNANAKSRMVRAVVSESTGRVLAAEVMESKRLPDSETRRQVEAGRGM